MDEPDDLSRVTALLGREPRGAFSVVVRDLHGDPVVIENHPLLHDGTPMPTRYWLVGAEAVRSVSRLEAAGGVRDAEAAIDPAVLTSAHDRYAVERDALLPSDHHGPRPSGGVGGTRTGVKCLHAHYAWHLAGGDDPVGHWVADRLEVLARTIEIQLDEHVVRWQSGAGWSDALPIDLVELQHGGLDASDPPAPEDLTNALGLVEDALNDLVRRHPELLDGISVRFSGDLARTLAQVEIGSNEVTGSVDIDREAVEDVFRTVATETAVDRAHNPGLPSQHVGVIVAATCVVVAVLRRFGLDSLQIDTGPTTP